jgi:16S rRNA (guanine966-N2)-methyltransferase
MSSPSTLRISGGEHRGRRIRLPKKHELRPTSDKARQAFFNIVGPRIDGATFLDLFSGTGVFAFEALSRGAARAIAVEKAAAAVKTIRETAEEIGIDLLVLESDVFSAVKRLEHQSIDVVYADPPYDFPRYDELVAAIERWVPLAPDAIVAIEHAGDSRPFRKSAERLRPQRTARYGTVAFTIFRQEELDARQ